jgi:hypothetical protein
MKSVSSGKLRKVANETHTQGRSCPDSIGSPGVRGSAPGVELDVRSACPLCPSPSVARVYTSRWCPGRPAGRAQRPLTPSAIMLTRPTEGAATLRTPRQTKAATHAATQSSQPLARLTR